MRVEEVKKLLQNKSDSVAALKSLTETGNSILFSKLSISRNLALSSNIFVSSSKYVSIDSTLIR